MILSDCRIGLKQIAEALSASFKCLHHLVNVVLDMRKIRIPICLGAEQKLSFNFTDHCTKKIIERRGGKLSKDVSSHVSMITPRDLVFKILTPLIRFDSVQLSYLSQLKKGLKGPKFSSSK